MKRMHFWLPEKDEAAIVKAAAKETAKTGVRLTVSEYIRRAVQRALQSK